MAISNILLTFGIFYDHLVDFVFIWYIRIVQFGIMHHEKSGNPAQCLGTVAWCTCNSEKETSPI
jgi:hypothetical protein